MRGRRGSGPARQHLAWLGAGLVVGFVVPFLFADVLRLPRDLYYGIYIVAVLAFFVLWARTTGQRLDVMLRRRWRLAVVLGVVFARRPRPRPSSAASPPAPGPEGLALVWAVLWRGSPTAPPTACCSRRFRSWPCSPRRGHQGPCARGPSRRGRRAAGVAEQTTVYHLGYSDFRSPLLARPVAADLVWSVPTLVTLNPIGAPIAHAAMHVAAVLHSYDTEVFLPPHR